MDIDTIRLFGEVVSRSSITEAARRLYMSQQALSRKLAALEDEVGHQLINRTTPLTLTPAGKVFLREANGVVSAYERMMRAVGEQAKRPTAAIRVRDYGTGSFASLFAGTLALLSREHPEIDVRFVRVNEDDLSLLDAGEVDVGFVRSVSVDGADGLSRRADLVYLPLPSDSSPLVFGVPEGHELLTLANPTLRDVGRYRIAMPTDTDRGALPLAVKDLFARSGVNPDVESVYCTAASERFFEFFSGKSCDSVAFFTERSFADYMGGAWPGGCAHRPLHLADHEYSVESYAVYTAQNANPALPAFVEALRRVDEGLA